MWAAREKRKKRGKTDLNVTCNVGWLVLFLFVSDYLRQDYLFATLQINPSVLAIRKFEGFRYTDKPIFKNLFL